jgi:hypothetical protein
MWQSAYDGLHVVAPVCFSSCLSPGPARTTLSVPGSVLGRWGGCVGRQHGGVATLHLYVLCPSAAVSP